MQEGLPDISGIDMNQSNLYGDVKNLSNEEEELFSLQKEKEKEKELLEKEPELDPDEVLKATKELLD